MEIHLPKRDERKAKVLQCLSSEFPRLAPQMLAEDMAAKHGLTIALKPMRTKRSRPQEIYYRKWCGGFAKYCGLTPDEMHDELLCQCYGSEEVVTKFGIKKRPLKRSGDTSRGDYSDLIETLMRISAEMGYYIPDTDGLDDGE